MILPASLHRWDLGLGSAIRLQHRLARRVELEPLTGEPRLIAGLDAAFSSDGRWCLAAAVLWDRTTDTVLEVKTARRKLRFPYVPGLLSFREAPALLGAFRRLERVPELVLCDGQGIAHPRRFGIACHLGVWLGLPTVGCAKSRLVGEHGELGRWRGSLAPLFHRGFEVGTVVRTQDGVRPVYVSPGHRIDLVGAAQWVLSCTTRFRLPEPTRLADRQVAKYKRSYQCPSGSGGGPSSSG